MRRKPLEIEFKDIPEDGVEVNKIYICVNGKAFELFVTINEMICVQPHLGVIEIEVSTDQLNCIVCLVDPS